jgi:hypothetical protein
VGGVGGIVAREVGEQAAGESAGVGEVGEVGGVGELLVGGGPVAAGQRDQS